MASMSPFASARSCTRPWWRDVFCPFAIFSWPAQSWWSASACRTSPTRSIAFPVRYGRRASMSRPDGELGGHAIKPKAVLATNDYHHLRSRALGGDVVTELPPFLAAAPIRERRLVPLLPPYP